MVQRMVKYLMYACFLCLIFYSGSLFSQSGSNVQGESKKIPGSYYHPRALDHFIRALIAEDQRDYARAILEYQDAISFDSTASIFYFSMGENYLRLRKTKNAVALFEKYLFMEPRDAQVHYILKEIYKQQRNFPKVEWVMERMRWMKSYPVTFYYDLLQIYLINGKDKKAYDLARELSKRSDADESMFESIKNIYLTLKKIPQSISLFEQLMLDNPENGIVKYGLGDLYVIMGDSTRGKRYLEESLTLEPQLTTAQERLTELYLFQRKPEKALSWFDNIDIGYQLSIAQFYFFAETDSIAEPLFTKIRDNNPNDSRSYFFLGLISMQKNDFLPASQLFTKAAGLDSTKDRYYYYAGHAFLRLNKHDEAVYYFTKATELNSSDAGFYFWLAYSYFRQKKYAEAKEYVGRVLNIKPGDGDSMDLLSDILYHQGRFDEAEEIYLRVIAADSMNVKAVNNYSYMLAERGVKLEEALRMSKRVIEKQPDNQSYLDTLGWIYYKLGRYQEALKYLHKAAQVDSNDNSIIFDHLGDIYFKLGDIQKARLYWKKVLELDGENTIVRKKLEEEIINP